MVSRLPTPGGDEDLWGDVLNDYLAVSLNTDGTIKNSAVSSSALATSAVQTTKIADSNVTEAKLDATLTTKVNAQPQTLAYSNSGNLSIKTGTTRLYNDSGSAWTIQSIRTSVGTPPTGASVIVDVNIDGTTMFTTQANRPTIAVSTYTSGAVTNMDTTSVANGSYLTVDIDQVGSTVAGADLCVQVSVR